MNSPLTVRVDDRRIGIHCHNFNDARRVEPARLCGSSSLGERDLLGDGRLLQTSTGGFGPGILDKEHLIRGRVPYHSFVEERVAGCLSDERELGVGADNGVELLVVYVERLGRQAIQRGPWGSDDLEKSASRYIVLYVQCSDLPVRVVVRCRARRTSWGRSAELEPGYPHHSRRGRQGRRVGSGSGAERCFPQQG